MNERGFTLGSVLVASSLVLLFGVVFTRSTQAQGDNLGLCLTRNNAVANAALLYSASYDDRLPPSIEDGRAPCNLTRYFGNIIFPYHNSWLNYRCPSDDLAEVALGQNPCGVSRRRADIFTVWGLKAHRGYNWLMLAPMANVGNTTHSYPILASEIADPSSTIMLIDSIWDRMPNGSPSGGGNFVVDAPCFRHSSGQLALPLPPGTTSYYWVGGWNLGTVWWNEFGGAWHWHGDVFAGVMADGTARTFTQEELTAGCENPGYSGRIIDPGKYLWDTSE